MESEIIRKSDVIMNMYYFAAEGKSLVYNPFGSTFPTWVCLLLSDQ